MHCMLYIPQKKKKKNRNAYSKIIIFFFLKDRKCYSDFVYIILMACRWLLDCTSFISRSQKCVQENWLQTSWGQFPKLQKNCVFVMLSHRIRLSNVNRLYGPKNSKCSLRFPAQLWSYGVIGCWGVFLVWLLYGSWLHTGDKPYET